MLMALALGFSACQKCGTCTTTTVIEANPPTTGYPQTSTSTSHLCGDEFEKMDGFSQVTSSTSGDVTVTITTTAKCLKD